MEDIEKDLKEAISKVNDSLMSYEKDWSSCLRLVDDLDSKERADSFEHWIELRFNFESSKIPALRKLQEETQGHLFSCTEVEEFDEKKRKYKIAHLQLLNPDDVDPNSVEINDLRNGLIEVEKMLGGNQISFNSVQKKIKLIIGK